MKKTTTTIFQIALVLFVLVQFHLNAQTYNLVWQDEFNGGMSNAWRHETGGGGWGNNEQQYYQPQNTSFSATDMIITARKEYVGGHNYTSSRIITHGSASPKSFTYGRMESRMRLPMGQGLWPAFWTLGTNIGSVSWPHCGEIDIMEHINNDATVFGTIHWQGPNGYATYGANSPATTPASYHTYRVDWNASDIRWFIDGAQYHIVSIANSTNSTEEFHRPMYFLYNLAVGGNFPGHTIDESRLPAQFFIDYIRVYQTGSSPTTFSQTIEAENFIASAGVIVENCSEGGQNVGSFDVGDWTAYNVNIPATGTYKVTYRVSSIHSGRTLRLEKDNGATILGTITIPNTGNWQAWTSVSHNITLPGGAYTIGMATGTGGFNINRFNITNNLARIAPAEEITLEPVSAVSVYPNPVVGRLNYTLPKGVNAHNIQIKDFQGKAVSNFSFSEVGDENSLDLSNLKKGMYIITISDKGFNKTFKVQKE